MGLFDAFDKVSHQNWVDKINADLKGKDFQETLVWNSDEGIDVQPFYNSSSNSFSATPLKQTVGWKIRQTIAFQSVEEGNKIALLALKGGANSLVLHGSITTQSEMDQLFKDIQTDIIEVQIYNSNPNKITELITLSNGSISYDYLGEFLTQGKWVSTQENDINELTLLSNSDSDLKTITICGGSGIYGKITMAQELAYTMSQGVEYLNLLTDKGIEAEKIANKIQFTTEIGSNYFFEIAKLRAARKLWAFILKQYNVGDTEMIIHATTSIAHFSEEDKNYDLLRNTTKAMSAIIGSCDSLEVMAHDNSVENIEFANRIARNIQHILKEEAFFGKVINPADGAYYIESLTDELSRKAWDLFKTMESQGGFLSCIENNFISIKND